MADILELEVITTTDAAIREEITELYIPAYYGEAGILKNHLPYISLLKFGEISFKDISGKHHYLYIENGFVEVRDNKIILISDLAKRAEDFDIGEIRSGIEKIDKKINSASAGEITAEELDVSLEEKEKLTIQADIIKKSGLN
ncbi:MAG: ATP synthase F1 subunit epsilon [Acidobacteriota bacterium]